MEVCGVYMHLYADCFRRKISPFEKPNVSKAVPVGLTGLNLRHSAPKETRYQTALQPVHALPHVAGEHEFPL